MLSNLDPLSISLSIIPPGSITSYLLDKNLVDGYLDYPYFLEELPSIIKVLCNSDVTVNLPDVSGISAILLFDAYAELVIDVISNKKFTVTPVI